MTDQPEQTPTPTADGAARTVTAPPEAPHGRCRHCRGPLPAPAATGRRREYHRGGEGPGGQDCKEAARRARESAVGAIVEQPLQALIAWAEREEAERRRHAELLAAAAERDRRFTGDLTDLRETLLTRNTELEAAIVQAAAQATEAETARDAAERRERTAQTEAADARGDARRAGERADGADERARLAERVATAEQAARSKAEKETEDAVASGNQARAALAEAQRRLTEAEERLGQVQADLERLRVEVERVRAEREDRAARLETATADLAAARQLLTGKDTTIGDLTGRLERAEQETAAVRDTAADQVRHADEQRQSALGAAERMRGERDQARTDLIAGKAAHHAERQVLERERDAARSAEGEQRERAVRAEQAVQANLVSPPGAEGAATDVEPSGTVGAQGE
ncbi:hypothetical protein [Actinomadura sp. GTD37]|uniref:hypothetical protein n=1 Tax=Actinomadura sp. GTD37 TaxID=1778030 RepID=UPI0035C028AE